MSDVDDHLADVLDDAIALLKQRAETCSNEGAVERARGYRGAIQVVGKVVSRHAVADTSDALPTCPLEGCDGAVAALDEPIPGIVGCVECGSSYADEEWREAARERGLGVEEGDQA